MKRDSIRAHQSGEDLVHPDPLSRPQITSEQINPAGELHNNSKCHLELGGEKGSWDASLPAEH